METHHSRGPDGQEVDAYGSVMAVATAIIALGIAVTAALGPEERGKQFHLEPPDSTDAVQPINDLEAGNVEDTITQHAEEEEKSGAKHV